MPELFLTRSPEVRNLFRVSLRANRREHGFPIVNDIPFGIAVQVLRRESKALRRRK